MAKVGNASANIAAIEEKRRMASPFLSIREEGINID
jgi:hypothetical protein